MAKPSPQQGNLRRPVRNSVESVELNRLDEVRVAAWVKQQVGIGPIALSGGRSVPDQHLKFGALCLAPSL